MTTLFRFLNASAPALTPGVPMMMIAVMMLVMGFGWTATSPARAESQVWDGLWFECEFAGRQAPPADDCVMLDDDGFLFSANRITYMKVIDSTETKGCKKQRAGQCFQAAAPAITVTEQRNGKAKFTDTTIGLRFLGCTQIFHMTTMGDFVEAKPDADRCYWAGEKHFYLRKYRGKVTVD